jgi:predicted RNA-binding protein with PIN domain
MGTLISFGSYNNYNTNVVRDVYLFTACNAFTCVYACAVVFTILGFKAQTLFDRCMHEYVKTLKKKIFSGQCLYF